VIVGTSVPTVVTHVKRDALADVMFWDARFGLLASTLPIDDTGLPPSFGGAAPSGTLEVREFAGREQQLLYAPLMIRGEQIGGYAVALPTDFLATAQTAIQGQATTFFVILTIAVLLTGWALSRLFTGPLSQLVRTSRLVASGDLTRRTGIRQRDEIGELAASFDSMTDALRRQQLGAMEALVSAVDARDPYTCGHSVRVGHLARRLGNALGLEARELHHLQLGGYFHDIGKIGIRDHVLLKPGALTLDERELVQAHPSIGLGSSPPSDSPPRCCTPSSGTTSAWTGAATQRASQAPN
jgi:HAMP domain-containing protein